VRHIRKIRPVRKKQLAADRAEGRRSRGIHVPQQSRDPTLAERFVTLCLERHDERRAVQFCKGIEAELDVEQNNCRKACESAHKLDLERPQ
jgi:hypothetical protein